MLLHTVGYRVVAAATPEEAIRLSRESNGTLHLLITDVVMPGMNGSDLAKHLQTENPQLKCIFVSGQIAYLHHRKKAL
jgi:YesN/AraC family two-component response regulator